MFYIVGLDICGENSVPKLTTQEISFFSSTVASMVQCLVLGFTQMLIKNRAWAVFCTAPEPMNSSPRCDNVSLMILVSPHCHLASMSNWFWLAWAKEVMAISDMANNNLRIGSTQPLGVLLC